jgi:hypothetical protein
MGADRQKGQKKVQVLMMSKVEQWFSSGQFRSSYLPVQYSSPSPVLQWY